MNDRVTSAKRPAPGQSAMSKADKRAAAKAARAAALAAQQRRQLLSVIGTVVAVLVILVGGGYLLFGRGSSTPSATASAGTSPSAPAADASNPAPTASAAPFPALPPGADPALGTKPAVKAGTGTVSKLTVTTLIPGKGDATKAGQTLSVNYVGVTYADGKEFDSSWSRSQPITFKVGGGQVIQGWDQGLVGVKIGSRVQLDIPGALAYGDAPTGGQPAGTLRFVVDVLSAT